jgi:hypothetical protein
MKRRFYLIVFIVLLAMPVSNWASWEIVEKAGWLELGLGNGKIQTWTRAAMFAQFTQQRNNKLFSLRALSIFRPFSEGPYDRGWEIGVLYGRLFPGLNKHFKISVSGGLAFTGVDDKWEMTHTIGVPLEAKVSLAPFRHVGLFITAYVNINPVNTYHGVLIGIQIGKLYPR